MAVGSGDKLARGAAKAQFPSCSHVTQEKWDAIFSDYTPESGSGDSNPAPAGDAGSDFGETKSDS